MNSVSATHHIGIEEPLRIGDDPAIDFLNTTVMENGVLTDRLQSDADVLQWLRIMGFGKPNTVAFASGTLLKIARTIREALRIAVENASTGKAINWRYWNTLLVKSPSHLVINADGCSTTQRWGTDSPEQVLGPVIAAAVELLTTGDFELVRKCDDDACVLWFYDRTKSHRRRWCSMSTCGNRNKVAAFRERQQAGA